MNKDRWYKFKLWFGFTFLGWHKPKDFDYGYFSEKVTLIRVYRDENGEEHRIMMVYPESGVTYE